MSGSGTSKARYSGLTWDHPRGFDALHAAEAHVPGLISWTKQPLAGFESASIGELCAAYDVIVMDHPHLGEALGLGCLRPLDALFSDHLLSVIRERAVGRSFSSYEMEGHQWALPLDAATQVLALRPDLIEPVELWSEVVALSNATGLVALSLQGPHAWLTFLSILTALGSGLNRDGAAIPLDAGVEALELMRAIHGCQPAGTERLNPIEMLDAMQRDSAIALCPLIFGYVPYTRMAPALAFHDAPRQSVDAAPGSVIGGTGICISTRCEPSDDLLRHLAWLLSPEAQCTHLPQNSGQPSARIAWQSDAVNRAAGNFYRNTEATMDAGIVRPRFDGYIAFQNAAAETLRQSLAHGADSGDTIAQLNAGFARTMRDAKVKTW